MSERALDLDTAELTLRGRITTASNATFLGAVGDVAVVYKPVAGERPLWDFPDTPLAHREMAAYSVSEALGWGMVPETWLRDGPHGPGMVQRWCEPDPAQDPVTIVPEGNVSPGYRHVLDALGANDEPVSLVHEDSAELRRMAIFDLVVNNADRKGGHILPMTNGHRYGIDHGICFHAEPKLRTVLWGWAGEPLTSDESEELRRLRTALDGDLQLELAGLLGADELDALAARCDRLIAEPVMPWPSSDWPPIPWPPF